MKKLIVITGPTASGKTSVSLKLARFYNSEIISADSRQFYRGMNIGTAKPSEYELKSVRHHFINTLDVTENYNIGKFETDAIELIDSLFHKHDMLFLTGGSGLYIDTVCGGIDELPESSEAIREELSNMLETEGLEALRLKLKENDPEYYSRVDINNPHRILRALEIILLTGKKVSLLRTRKKKKRDFQIKTIVLKTDRTELYSRINARVDEMIQQGLVDEVKSFLPYRNENALQTVGYKEIFSYLDNNISLEEAVNLIKQHTRNYAKRQMTWWRKEADVHFFVADDINGMKSFIES